MADIILDDLMRWETGRLRPATGDIDDRLRSRPVSWAVTIRATAPVLPQLRGDELVVAPSSVLEELREMEDVGWDDLVGLLQLRPVAAILTDDGGTSPPDIPVLVAGSEFVAGAEAALNREVTERRATLYRLGSDLSRALTSASMAGAGLDQFLNAAEAVSGLPLALLTATGTPLAHSQGYPADTDIDPGAGELAAGHEADRVEMPQGDWLLAGVESNALPPGVVLAVGIERGASGERARLVLREVAQALSLLFDRLPPLAAPTIERERERFIRDVLLGRVAPGPRRWRRMLPALDPESPVRVGLQASACSLDGLGAILYRAGLEDGGQALLFADALTDQVVALAARGDLPPLVLSEAVGDPAELPATFRRVQAAVRLASQGRLTGNVVDLSDARTGGVMGLVLSLADPRGPDAPGSRALTAYADGMLGNLDEYDASHGGVLVESLAAYFQAGSSVTLAAGQLGVHRNTLAYRLSRISEIAGYDLDDPAQRQALHLAVSIRYALDALFPEQQACPS